MRNFSIYTLIIFLVLLLPNLAGACTFDLLSTVEGKKIAMHLSGGILCRDRIDQIPENDRVFSGYYKTGLSDKVEFTGKVLIEDEFSAYGFLISSKGYEFDLKQEWDCRDTLGLTGRYHDGSESGKVYFETMHKLTEHISPSGTPFNIVFKNSSNAYSKDIVIEDHKISVDMPCDGGLGVDDVKKIDLGSFHMYEVSYAIGINASGPITGPATVFVHQNGDKLIAGVSGNKDGYFGEWYNFSRSICEMTLVTKQISKTCHDWDYKTVKNEFFQVERKTILVYEVDKNGFHKVNEEKFKREEILSAGQISSIENKEWDADS